MATNWNKDKPAGTDKIRDSDDLIRANNAALEDAIARNHNFPGDEGSNAGEHTIVELQDQSTDPSTPANIISLYNNADELFARLQNDGAIIQLGASAIPTGTKMLFPQSSAPTGWTFNSENNDRVLINQSTEANGGTTAGSWTISGITGAGHTLITSEMPAHTHTGPFSGTGGEVAASGSGSSVHTNPHTTSSTGGGGSHNHNVTSDGSWRPEWLGVITCTKD